MTSVIHGQQKDVYGPGTFSKILCPGLRIAWIVGPEALIRKYVLVKQGTDLLCNTLAQFTIVNYLELFDIDAHIETIREAYGRRCAVMQERLEQEMPEGVAWTRPEGGLLIWLELPARHERQGASGQMSGEEPGLCAGRGLFPQPEPGEHPAHELFQYAGRPHCGRRAPSGRGAAGNGRLKGSAGPEQ